MKVFFWSELTFAKLTCSWYDTIDATEEINLLVHCEREIKRCVHVDSVAAEDWWPGYCQYKSQWNEKEHSFLKWYYHMPGWCWENEHRNTKNAECTDWWLNIKAFYYGKPWQPVQGDMYQSIQYIYTIHPWSLHGLALQPGLHNLWTVAAGCQPQATYLLGPALPLIFMAPL